MVVDAIERRGHSFLTKNQQDILIFLHDHNTDKFTMRELKKVSNYRSETSLKEFLVKCCNYGLVKKTIINGQRRKYCLYEIKAEANFLAEKLKLLKS